MDKCLVPSFLYEKRKPSNISFRFSQHDSDFSFTACSLSIIIIVNTVIVTLNTTHVLHLLNNYPHVYSIFFGENMHILTAPRRLCLVEGKGNVNLYSASSQTPLMRSDMDHTVHPAKIKIWYAWLSWVTAQRLTSCSCSVITTAQLLIITMPPCSPRSVCCCSFFFFLSGFRYMPIVTILIVGRSLQQNTSHFCC